ncbi:ketopantoate reductase family protein [Chloroflexota bacterium]
MKILFYGAGVLGSLYAARLQAAGQAVSILARGQRLSDIREHGIVLEDGDTRQRITTRVNVVEHLAPDDAYDLVVVLMRKNQVSAILPILAANRHTPNVLFMGNNAAGPDEMVEALGRERVLLGFARVGGYREGHVIITKVASSGPTPIGELDGQSTPRLQQITEAFKTAGFSVAISPKDAWLKTHFVEIGPVAHAIYLARGDNYRLARTRDGLVLTIRAIREGYEVLRALGVPITPANHKIFNWISEPILVALMRRLFNTKTAEIEMSGHANAARDEFKHLAGEFRALARTTSVPTPALDRLYTYIDPAVPPLPEGSTQISPSWRSV